MHSSRSPLAALVGSRKGISAIIATALGVLGAVAMTVTYFQGKFSPEQYWSHLEKIGMVVTAAWGLVIVGNTVEDAAMKSKPTITAGGDVSVTTTKEENLP